MLYYGIETDWSTFMLGVWTESLLELLLSSLFLCNSVFLLLFLTTFLFMSLLWILHLALNLMHLIQEIIKYNIIAMLTMQISTSTLSNDWFLSLWENSMFGSRSEMSLMFVKFILLNLMSLIKEKLIFCILCAILATSKLELILTALLPFVGGYASMSIHVWFVLF